MAFGQSPTTTTEGPLASNQIFISSVATPNTANGDLTALEGGPVSTDSNGNKTAPASMYVKDGNDLTVGSKADSAITDSTTTNTHMSFLKGLVKILASVWDSVHGRLIVDGSGVTQPVSAASLPLPTGASTSAKQPALGTAGTASSDVITVQGIASMTPVKVDGSGVTQPVSGSVTETNSSSINTHLANIDSDSASLVTNTTGLATQATLAAAKTDLDTIVTNTNKIPASPAQEGGNLATIAGAIVGSKAQANIAQINGQTPTLDNTTILAASMRGKNSVAGDTPIKVNANGDQYVLGDFTEQTGLSAGSLNADLIPSTDISAYNGVSVHVGTSAYVGTLSVQGSNDNVNWYNQPNCIDIANSGSYVATFTTTNIIIFIPRFFRYLRIRMTSYTSGTAQATAEFYTHSPLFIPRSVTTVTANPSNTPNTTPWLISFANNNASVPSGAANTVIKNAAGSIATIVITTAGSGAGNVQIFDNASTNSGTVLAAFPANATAGQSFQVYGWAKNGMTAQNVASGPVFTVYYA